MKYWRSNIILAIAGVGTPVTIDDSTRKKVFGHYARALVDINLHGGLRDSILVERESFAFFVNIEYEKIPEFCNFCKHIGHVVSNCKKKSFVDSKMTQEDPKAKLKPSTKDVPKSVYITMLFMLLRPNWNSSRYGNHLNSLG